MNVNSKKFHSVTSFLLSLFYIWDVLMRDRDESKFGLHMCSNTDELRQHHPMWSQSEKDIYHRIHNSSVQFSSVAQSCLTLCDPMNRSSPGLPVHQQHPEFPQTHVHHVSDAIQPCPFYLPILLMPPIPPSIRVFSNESTLRRK